MCDCHTVLFCGVKTSFANFLTDVVLVQMEGNDAAGVEVYEGLCSIEDNEDEGHYHYHQL